jgi:hypothetical protein
MTILYINTGTSANAGNGDSIRLAFTKVNNNFEDLLGRLDNAQFPNIFVNNGYFGTIVSTGTFTTLDLVSTGTALVNDLAILGNVNGTVNFTDTSTFVNITVTDTATVNHVATQYLTVANTATFNSDIVVNGNYIGTLTLAGTSTFDNIIVNNTATLNDLTINGSVTAGFYQGFDDFNIIKDDINGLNFRLRNIHADSYTEYNLLDNISGGLTIAHQNSTNDSGRYLAGQNYIIGLTPSDTLNIGRYSDIKFYADASAYASHHELVPVIVIDSNTQQVNILSWTFGTDGGLTFPNNSIFDGQTLIDSATSTNYTLKIANGGEAGSKFGIGTGDATFGIANDALNHAEDGYVPYTVTAQQISLTVPGAGAWSFGTDRLLSLPTGGTVSYEPAVDTDWIGSPPTTIQEALDRIAAAIKALNGTGA